MRWDLGQDSQRGNDQRSAKENQENTICNLRNEDPKLLVVRHLFFFEWTLRHDVDAFYQLHRCARRSLSVKSQGKFGGRQIVVLGLEWFGSSQFNAPGFQIFQLVIHLLVSLHLLSWKSSFYPQASCDVVQKHCANPLWHFMLFVHVENHTVGQKGATDLKHGNQKDLYNNGRGIWHHWDAVRHGDDDKCHGQEGFNHQCNALTKLSGEKKGEHGKTCQNQCGDNDVEHIEARFAPNVDCKGDVWVRLWATAGREERFH